MAFSNGVPAGLEQPMTSAMPRPQRRTSSISYSNGVNSLTSRAMSRSRPQWLVAVSFSQQLATMLGDHIVAKTVLLQLQASLHAQSTAVAREYGLKSPQGLTLSTSMGDGPPPAIFVEESWAVAWAPVFASEGQAATLAFSSAGTIPRIVLPIAAVLEAGYDVRQSRQRAPSAISPSRKTLPAQPSLLVPSTTSEPLDVSGGTPSSDQASRRNAAIESDITPAGYSRPNPSLIERDWNIKMRTLAECSELSPIAEVFAKTQIMPEYRIEIPGYPYSLSAIYPDTYPHFQLYPSLGPANMDPQALPPLYSPERSNSPALPYPYSLNATYPDTYPFCSIYPAKETCKLSIPPLNQGGRACYPVSRFGYPTSLSSIYPSVYPYLEPYPPIAPIMPDRQQIMHPVISLPRRKVSASQLSPIAILKDAGKAHLLSSPSERIDRDASQDVASFRRKRAIPALVLGGADKPASVLQSSTDAQRPGLPRRPSTPFSWSAGNPQAPPPLSPCLPLPSPGPSFHLSPTSPPVYAS